MNFTVLGNSDRYTEHVADLVSKLTIHTGVTLTLKDKNPLSRLNFIKRATNVVMAFNRECGVHDVLRSDATTIAALDKPLYVIGTPSPDCDFIMEIAKFKFVTMDGFVTHIMEKGMLGPRPIKRIITQESATQFLRDNGYSPPSGVSDRYFGAYSPPRSLDDLEVERIRRFDRYVRSSFGSLSSLSSLSSLGDFPSVSD